jgi:transcriptional regulator with XRE-family HTH domain
MPRPISTKTPLGLLRSELGISAAKMAKLVGLGVSTLQKIEQGKFAMTEGVAQKISHAYLVNHEWLLRGKASDGIQGIIDRPWDKRIVELIRMRFGSQMDDEIRGVAKIKAQQILEKLALIFNISIDDGNCWQVMIDADIALDEIIRTYYPATHEKFLKLQQLEAKRSSQKPRKKAGC